MSEKFSARTPVSISPLRSNTFVTRATNATNKITTKRSGGVRKSDKIIDEKKNEVKTSNGEICREEFGADVLNLTLVGSPAPRSQVRALVSSTSIAAKSKVKTSYGSKSREQNHHEICMEKLYQFADNPTKFVRSESRDESQLRLDLEFSDRSEESENFYNSHNIAFGENGEYRIPEYDHIRFLQFSIGNNQDPGITEDRDNSSSAKFDRSTVASSNTAINSDQPIYERFHHDNRASTISDGPETPGSFRADGSLDLSETGAPQIDEINPWNANTNLGANWPMNNATLDSLQNYPLGSAINYKNTINPEVEKFMLDTGPESFDENYATDKSLRNNRILDESILSKKFTQAIRLQPSEESVEISSRTSPITSRTTLSQASSGDGTWHGHSLNSPYFASGESVSWTESKKQVGKDLPKVLSGYEENEEYLTIVKNEQESTPTSQNGGVQRYIFITNQFMGSELQSRINSQSVLKNNDRCQDIDKVVDSSIRDNSSTKIHRSQSLEIANIEVDDAEDISSGKSSSEYFIGKIFPRSSSSVTDTSSSSAPSSSSIENVKSHARSGSVSLGDGTEIKKEKNEAEGAELNASSQDNRGFNSLKNSLESDGFYMTLEEVNMAADYTSKLSDIFNRVLKRSECESRLKISEALNAECSTSTGGKSQNTSKLIHTCLGSRNFCTSNISP